MKEVWIQTGTTNQKLMKNIKWLKDGAHGQYKTMYEPR
jgi:hypothetical protein